MTYGTLQITESLTGCNK